MPMFENIKDTIAEHDLAFCNMETPFGGKELGYSGYPTFNTPHEIGDNLIDLGFNLFSLATNHTMDKGAKGAINSLNYWNSKENILTAGSYLSEEARKEVRIREKNNIKYTMLAYLGTWTNHALPSNQQYLLNMYDKEKVKADIERVRDEVDLLIVSMHWGQEYKLEPNAKQREMAEYLASLGVDIIIGHHTHSVQPIEYIGNTLVFYSLGNFISNQPNYDDLIGLMPTLKVTKTVDKDNNVTMQISDVEANLIYTAYDGTRCELCYHSNYRIIPFGQLTPEILPQYKTYYDKYKTVLTSLDPDIVVGPIDE
jgi:poly-gamma-glutamate synthesis protein (capsule biosynthesis protein)